MIKTLLNILTYLLFPIIFVLIYTNIINTKNIIIPLTISYIILLIYFIIKYITDLKKDIKKFNKKHIITIIKYWIIGFLLIILSNYIINHIIIPNGISNNEASNIKTLLNNKVLYPLSTCLLIPIIEEIAFRLEIKKKYNNKTIFLLLSSIPFALLHIIASTKPIEIIYFIPYFILSLTFSNIYYKTNNIYSNIITHIIHNTIITIFYLITL